MPLQGPDDTLPDIWRLAQQLTQEERDELMEYAKWRFRRRLQSAHDPPPDAED